MFVVYRMDVRILFLILSFLEVSSAAVFRGIKMCEKECQFSKHCSAVEFDPVNLRCTLLPTAPSSPKSLVLRVEKDPEIGVVMRTCQGVLLLDRRGQLVCVQVKGANCSLEKISGPKLLLYQYFSTAEHAHVMDLTTHVICKLDFFWNHVYAVVFYKAKFVISFGRAVMLVYPGTHKQSVIKSGSGVRDMRIDKEKAWIFYVMKTTLARVSITGKQYREIFSGLSLFFDLDEREKRVYVSTAYGIMSLSYDGSTACRLPRIRNPALLAFDPSSGVVYFTSMTDVMSLKNNQVSVLKNLKPLGMDVECMRVHLGVLYLTWKENPGLFHIYLISEKRLELVTLSSDAFSMFSEPRILSLR